MDRAFYLRRADEYIQHEHFVREIDCYDQILEENPDDVEVLSRKGLAYANLDKPENAIKYFDKALERDPSDADTWEHKGNATTCLKIPDLKKYSKALTCYEMALGIKSDSYLLMTKGETLSSLGRYTEGLDCMDVALEMDPDNSEIWNAKAEILGELERDDEGLKCVRKAMQIEEHEGNRCYGRMLFYRKRHDEAITALRKELEREPNDHYLHAVLGMVYSHLGMYDEAMRCYDVAIELESESVACEFREELKKLKI